MAVGDVDAAAAVVVVGGDVMDVVVDWVAVGADVAIAVMAQEPGCAECRATDGEPKAGVEVVAAGVAAGAGRWDAEEKGSVLGLMTG